MTGGMEALPEGYEWLKSGRWRVALRSEDREMLLAAGAGDPGAIAARDTPSTPGAAVRSGFRCPMARRGSSDGTSMAGSSAP